MRTVDGRHSKRSALVAVGLVTGLLALAVGQVSVAAATPSVSGLRSADPPPPLPTPGLVHSRPVPGSPWQHCRHHRSSPAHVRTHRRHPVGPGNGPSNDGTGEWWRLTPNNKGSYVDGTWSQVASMPSAMHRRTMPRPCSPTDGSSSRVVSTTPATRYGPTKGPSTIH